MFFYGPRCMDMPVLANQQELIGMSEIALLFLGTQMNCETIL